MDFKYDLRILMKLAIEESRLTGRSIAECLLDMVVSLIQIDEKRSV